MTRKRRAPAAQQSGEAPTSSSVESLDPVSPLSAEQQKSSPLTEDECAQLLEQAYPVRQRIALLLKDNKVGYTVAIVAMTQVMMDIGVLGLGLSEQQARRVMADLFMTHIMKQ